MGSRIDQWLVVQVLVAAALHGINGDQLACQCWSALLEEIGLMQQELLNARVSLINAERDRVVAAYNLLSAMGRLGAENIGLQVKKYDVEQHYNQVKDKWFGLRTPDNR